MQCGTVACYLMSPGSTRTLRRAGLFVAFFLEGFGCGAAKDRVIVNPILRKFSESAKDRDHPSAQSKQAWPSLILLTVNTIQ